MLFTTSASGSLPWPVDHHSGGACHAVHPGHAGPTAVEMHEKSAIVYSQNVCIPFMATEGDMPQGPRHLCTPLHEGSMRVIPSALPATGPSTSRQCLSDATPGLPSCSQRSLPIGVNRSQWHNNRRVHREEKASRKCLLIAQARRRDPIVTPFISLGEHPEDNTDLYGYLLRNRVIFIGSRINDEVATQIVASLLALETLSDSEDIKLYINSPGGQAYSVIAILDTIEAIKPDVVTIALGQCASTATLLLAAGTKGKRFSMPNARIMMHQPSGGAMGSADEVNIQASELNRTMKVVHRFYQRFTGLPLDRVEEETDRDNFMNPKQAMELGLIDDLILSAELPALATALA